MVPPWRLQAFSDRDYSASLLLSLTVDDLAETDAMSGRLASFKGPSTPNASPARAVQPTKPASPSRPTESTYHRKLRTLLYELRTITENWDDIVLVDGLKAAKSLVDTRTDLECVLFCQIKFDDTYTPNSNELGLIPAGTQPQTHIVQPKLAVMEKRISELDTVILKLVRVLHAFDAPSS